LVVVPIPSWAWMESPSRRSRHPLPTSTTCTDRVHQLTFTIIIQAVRDVTAHLAQPMREEAYLGKSLYRRADRAKSELTP